MQFYRDIHLRRDPELAPTILMNAAFTKLHIALVDAQHDGIGVSFPKADKTLGSCLRLHGSAEDLIALGVNWLRSLRQSVQIQEIQRVPDQHQHCRVQRIRVKSNPENLLRREIRKGRLEPSQAEEYLRRFPAQKSDLPFLNLKSYSTSHRYRLFIQQTQVEQPQLEGVFNTYGISQQATVPWF